MQSIENSKPCSGTLIGIYGYTRGEAEVLELQANETRPKTPHQPHYHSRSQEAQDYSKITN
jgi:hypothetical protein